MRGFIRQRGRSWELRAYLGTDAVTGRKRYAIRSGDEAAAYLAHPVLGARLRECATIVGSLDGRSAEEIFGHPDELKFRSSMTLFADVAPDEAVFQDCIDRYFDGEPDVETLSRL